VTGGNDLRPGVVLRLASAVLYGAGGLILVYRALNDVLAGRLSQFGLIGGVLGLAAVTIAAIYLWRFLGQAGRPWPS
jgi:hypothetical protein